MKDKRVLLNINLSLFAFLIFFSACLSDELPEPNVELCDTEEFNSLTYDRDMVQIVSTNCALSGCHGSGSFNGDFTTYEGMLPDLNNGRIIEEVVLDRTMPIGGNELTETERDMFNCWVEKGFPEN